ncbi:MAG: FHA domain-containing protein [Vicinamibacteria bacterium]
MMSLFMVDDSYRLSDLDSTNRTWVNGHKIRNAVLRDGDQIRVGRTTFVFEWPAGPAGPNRED